MKAAELLVGRLLQLFSGRASVGRTGRSCVLAGCRCSIIGSPLRKVFPADNLLGRGRFLPVTNCRSEGDFSGGGDLIMERFFMWAVIFL